ncbi:MAG: hypothetical protein K0Q72_2806 [Armatimonadetes bacterium]|jgi:hypothetical protein|nr:hypothetical protein [Armatimonadota bacterium]
MADGSLPTVREYMETLERLYGEGDARQIIAYSDAHYEALKAELTPEDRRRLSQEIVHWASFVTAGDPRPRLR